MATRTLPVLSLAAFLAGAAAAAPPAEDGGPTPVERQLQRRYLDRTFLLRADVQVLVRQSKTAVALTYPTRPPTESTVSNTFVTPDGIYYTRDFDERMQLSTEVRVGAIGGSGTQGGVGGQQADLLNYGGTVGNVVDRTQSSLVVFRPGDLVRVVGVEDRPVGVTFHLEGFQDGRASVILRAGLAAGETPSEDLYPGLFGKIVYDVPEDRAGREAWIDPGWRDDFVTAIGEGKVLKGMSPLQVLLAWGTPLHASRDAEKGNVKIWLYNRGGTIRQQLSGGGTNVTFAGGKVVEIGGAAFAAPGAAKP